MTVLDLLHEIADIPPTQGRSASVASAARQLGVDTTTAYRWAREGMGDAKLSRVLTLVDTVNDRRRAAGAPALGLDELRQLCKGAA